MALARPRVALAVVDVEAARVLAVVVAGAVAALVDPDVLLATARLRAAVPLVTVSLALVELVPLALPEFALVTLPARRRPPVAVVTGVVAVVEPLAVSAPVAETELPVAPLCVVVSPPIRAWPLPLPLLVSELAVDPVIRLLPVAMVPVPLLLTVTGGFAAAVGDGVSADATVGVNVPVLVFAVRALPVAPTAAMLFVAVPVAIPGPAAKAPVTSGAVLVGVATEEGVRITGAAELSPAALKRAAASVAAVDVEPAAAAVTDGVAAEAVVGVTVEMPEAAEVMPELTLPPTVSPLLAAVTVPPPATLVPDTPELTLVPETPELTLVPEIPELTLVPEVVPAATLVPVAVEAEVMPDEALLITGAATPPPPSPPVTTGVGPELIDEFTVDCGLAVNDGLTNWPVAPFAAGCAACDAAPAPGPGFTWPR